MSEPDSPVLRLIPYLLAITAASIGGLFAIDATDEFLFGILSAAVLYFSGFYLSRYLINRFADRTAGGRAGDDEAN